MPRSAQPRPKGTLSQRALAIQEAVAGPDRYLDRRLDLVAWTADDSRRGIPTGETLLSSGGKWDRIEARFLDPISEGDAEDRVLVGVEESQVPFVGFLNEWLCDYRDGIPREASLVLMRGARRSGKTFAGVAAVVAVALDCPQAEDGTPLIAWLVCKSYREMFEVESWIRNRIPAEWYHYQGAPVFEFHLRNGQNEQGAIIRLLSADDDDATKQGRVDVCFINEPQKMGPRAIANAVLGSADLGGLVILGANRPKLGESRGEWMFDLVEAVEDEAVRAALGSRVDSLGVKIFDVDPTKNKSIDQVARHKRGRIAIIIDPSLVSDDKDDGKWRRYEDKALHQFNKHTHLHALPEPEFLPPDITRSVANDRGEWGDWTHACGLDFDWDPHIVGVLYRIFGSPEDPLFWAVHEFVGDEKWTIQRWIDAFGDWGARYGYTPENTLLIGDASGGRPSRASDPKTEGNERTSFEIIQAAERDGTHWTVIPPQDHRGKTGRARNPFVDERLDLANELLRNAEDRPLLAGGHTRFRIDPIRCPWLARCARESTTVRKMARRRLTHDQFAHAIDAATYPLWRLAPLPGQRGGGVEGFGGVSGFRRSGSPYPTR